jgi:hypothetical protein
MDLLEKYHFYINLDKRPEKDNQCISDLKEFGISQPNRFAAIKHEIGYVGCAQSHIKCIELAKERDYPFVCIFEDDIIFRNIDKCKEMISKYIDYDYDVLYLGCRISNNKYDIINNDLIRVNNAICNHAYIVKSHYYDKILENYREGVNLKLNSKEDDKYNMDIYTHTLQKKDKWYSFCPNFVSQREGHSDNLNKSCDICNDIFTIPVHDSRLPCVSLLTPTFNRTMFTELMITNIKHFSYPKEKIEWNILDSNDKGIENYKKLFDEESKIKQLENFLGIKINYIYTDERLNIGEKRNRLCEMSNYDYLINMDDDDIYLPGYINYSIDILLNLEKDITSCLDMLFIYPQNEFKTSYIRCVRDYKLYHEAPLCMKKTHWEKYKYSESSKGEGKTVYGDDKVCGISNVMNCMICICWDNNTVNKDMFLQYPVDLKIQGASMNILRNIFQKYKSTKENDKAENVKSTELNKMIEIAKSTDNIIISRKLLQDIRQFIEKITPRVKLELDELMPLGTMVTYIDKLLNTPVKDS